MEVKISGSEVDFSLRRARKAENPGLLLGMCYTPSPPLQYPLDWGWIGDRRSFWSFFQSWALTSATPYYQVETPSLEPRKQCLGDATASCGSWVGAAVRYCPSFQLRSASHLLTCSPSFEERKKLGLPHQRRGGNFKSKSR